MDVFRFSLYKCMIKIIFSAILNQAANELFSNSFSLEIISYSHIIGKSNWFSAVIIRQDINGYPDDYLAFIFGRATDKFKLTEQV